VLAQARDERLALHPGVGGRPVEHEADEVLAGERLADERRRDGDAALAHLVEDGLELVGERGHLVEPEHRARALDGVHGPESTGHEVHVVGGRFELEQRPLELGEPLRSLLTEGRRSLVEHVLHGALLS
jgi:hypothetical protein